MSTVSCALISSQRADDIFHLDMSKEAYLEYLSSQGLMYFARALRLLDREELKKFVEPKMKYYPWNRILYVLVDNTWATLPYSIMRINTELSTSHGAVRVYSSTPIFQQGCACGRKDRRHMLEQAHAIWDIERMPKMGLDWNCIG